MENFDIELSAMHSFDKFPTTHETVKTTVTFTKQEFNQWQRN